MRGWFITIEGPDGSGKSTQIDNIRDFFESRGYETLLTREPGGNAISERIRELLLDRANAEMTPLTETLLYAAARAQLVEQVIKPALSAGKVVICDRFVDSSLAYQGYGRGLGECVAVINDYAVNGCMPDITFLLKLDPERGRARINEADMDRIEAESITFHNRVYHGYQELERRFPERIKGLDATQSIGQISAEVARHLVKLLDGENASE